MKDLVNFLIEAKQNTYANKSAKTTSSKLNSTDYTYEKTVGADKICYHDSYWGSTSFFGKEIIYLNNKAPIWGMNYYGYAIKLEFYEEAINSVLRPALLKVDKADLPVRGPAKFTYSDYTYTFSYSGSIDHFTGVEKISKNGKLIYILHCSGGKIE